MTSLVWHALKQKNRIISTCSQYTKVFKVSVRHVIGPITEIRGMVFEIFWTIPVVGKVVNLRPEVATRWTKGIAMLATIWPSGKTPFKWRFTGGPIVDREYMLAGQLFQSSET